MKDPISGEETLGSSEDPGKYRYGSNISKRNMPANGMTVEQYQCPDEKGNDRGFSDTSPYITDKEIAITAG